MKRQAVVEQRKEHPEWGTRRIRDVLARFEGLGVSETEVRRILHEEGLIAETNARTRRASHPPRRFERAAPEPALAVGHLHVPAAAARAALPGGFMDDHSRFLVSSRAGAPPAARRWCWRRCERGHRGVRRAGGGADRPGPPVHGVARRDGVRARAPAQTASGTSRAGRSTRRRWARSSASGRRCGTSFCRARSSPTSPTASGGSGCSSTTTTSSGRTRR